MPNNQPKEPNKLNQLNELNYLVIAVSRSPEPFTPCHSEGAKRPKNLLFIAFRASAHQDRLREAISEVGSGGRVIVITHKENRGVGAAIVTGYKKALEENMDIAVVMAGDN